ncbi:type 1 glutamine amidotransferase [Pedobacter faecalis]|uniref:type 1 glutamine amidotransferase n=1 Tax=Pedobacter faecalis TaxID=3041495 RepID=UPI00254A1D3E|nr:type 1 glutamine amidotransferase [Pedobacter sp. ELA7]
MNIHYLQHVPFEGPGHIIEWAQHQGHQLSSTLFYEPEPRLPQIENIDFLVVMGGPMNVDDEHLYPWLNEEKQFILHCIRGGKKVLGICLGAQLIAACLGAKVITAPHKEIGWFPVAPTESAKEISGFYELFQSRPVVFHWHGDQFEIPAGSSNLLNTDANTNQAFLYNQHVLGLQFHLEVAHSDVERMVQECCSDIDESRYVQRIPELLEGVHHCSHNHQLLFSLLDWFTGSRVQQLS